MKERQSKVINTEQSARERDNENKTVVKRTTLIPLSIFFTVVAIYTIIRLCQLYVPAADNTKAAIDALVGFLTLIVIVIQSVILKRQWQAMQDALERTDIIIKATERQAVAAEETLKQTRRHFEMTERPVLGFARIYPSPQKDGNITIFGDLVNSGKVAAKILKQEVAYGMVDPSPEIKDGIVPSPPDPIALLGTPTIHINGRREVPFCKILREGWDEMHVEGGPILFIWAKFTYVGLTSPKEFILEHYAGWDAALEAFIEAPTHNEVT